MPPVSAMHGSRESTEREQSARRGPPNIKKNSMSNITSIMLAFLALTSCNSLPDIRVREEPEKGVVWTETYGNSVSASDSMYLELAVQDFVKTDRSPKFWLNAETDYDLNVRSGRASLVLFVDGEEWRLRAQGKRGVVEGLYRVSYPISSDQLIALASAEGVEFQWIGQPEVITGYFDSRNHKAVEEFVLHHVLPRIDSLGDN